MKLRVIGFSGPGFILVLAGPLSIPLGALFVAWSYVGAREVIGGIDGNGEEQREPERVAGLA